VEHKTLTESLFYNSNALVAIRKGTWALKLCCNKILQLLTVG